MNKTTHRVYQDPQDCCCCCSQKEQSSRGYGKKYSDGSPINGYESEDGNRNRIHNIQSLKINTGQRFAHEDLYDNLVDLIDDEMICTMSNLRKKARKFIKSEMDNLSSDAGSRPCTCPEEIRSRGANVTERAKTINYQPQSNFLQKMKHYYQSPNNEHSDVENRQNQGASKVAQSRSPRPKRKQSNVKPRSLEKRNGGETSPKSRETEIQRKQKQKSPVRKSEHISRPKKPTKGREKRKRFSSQKSESSLLLKLQPPHENSCERCWRYASPSRSPVNKPDQRYDPNFRRGHSCELFEKPEEGTDEKSNYKSPCKNLPPLPVTKKDNSPIIPPFPVARKSAQNIVQTPVKNYSPQFIPFRGRGTSSKQVRSSRPQTQEGTTGSKTRELAFDWPMRKSPTTPSQIDQMVHQTRSHTYEKRLPEEPRGGEFVRSVGRSRVKRPQTYSPGACRPEDYPNILDIETFRDICGATNLDPCMSRRPYGNEETIGLEIRGNGSGGVGAGRGLDASKGGGKDGRSGRDGMGGTDGIGGEDGKDGRDGSGNKAGIGSREGKGATGSREGGIDAKYGKNGRGSREGVGSREGLGSRGGRDEKGNRGGRSTADGKDSREGRGSASGREGYLSDDTDNLNKGASRAGTEGKGGKKSGRKNKDLLSSAASARANGLGGSDSKKSKKGGLKSSPKRKSPSRSKTPKNKSPPKSPKDSPQSAKDKKGSLSPRDEVNKNVPQSEAPSYFKLPEKSQASYDAGMPCNVEICVAPHPIRECQCFPRPASESGKNHCLCCHCNWKEPRRVSFDQTDNIGLGGRCSPPPPAPEPLIVPTVRLCPPPSPTSRLCPPPSTTPRPYPPESQTSRPCLPCRGPGLPNLSEYPEQLYGEMNSRAYTDRGGLSPCRRYPNMGPNPSKYQPANDCVPGGGNTEPLQMNGGMNFPRKYCVFYMLKGNANKGDDVEVLVEELSQACPKVNDGRMTDVCEKMKRVSQCPNESMALKFQKGVSECPRPPEKSRVLYF